MKILAVLALLLLPTCAMAADQTTPADTWMLITVSGSGTVSNSIYPTGRFCQEALSIALYGETVEEIAAAQANRRTQLEQELAIWETAHPPHAPRNSFEYSMVKECKLHKGFRSWNDSDRGVGHINTHCQVQDDDPYAYSTSSSPQYDAEQGQWLQNDPTTGQQVVKYASDVKTAQCIH